MTTGAQPETAPRPVPLSPSPRAASRDGSARLILAGKITMTVGVATLALGAAPAAASAQYAESGRGRASGLSDAQVEALVDRRRDAAVGLLLAGLGVAVIGAAILGAGLAKRAAERRRTSSRATQALGRRGRPAPHRFVVGVIR